MAYDLSQLKLEGISVKEIMDCHIHQKLGEHGTLTLTAIVEKDEFEEVTNLQPLRFYARGEQEETLFCGVITEIFQEEYAGLLRLSLVAKSYSYLMDIKKKSRTFQDVSMTYGGLLKKIVNEYGQGDCFIATADKPTGTLAVQYQETDWQFLKRMFSTLYTPLVCDCRIPSIRIYAGVPALAENHWEFRLQRMLLNFEEGTHLRETGYELRESDGLACFIYLEHWCGIYTSFVYKEIPMVATQLHAFLEKGFLIIEVELKKKESVAIVPEFPMSLVGLALEGTVLAVKGESVRLHFMIDDEYASSDVFWFPYSTPSASPDGSGWYYMPETGDRLRVYFPTKYMKDVLAISAVGCYSGKGGTPDRMANPNTKYLRSASGQEMNMGGDGIRLSSAGDVASLLVGNDGKINAKGLQIQVIAKESISISEATTISFHSKTGASYASQQGGSTKLEDTGNLRLSGTELKIN